MSAHFGSTYTKIGTIQRRFAWPLCKDDTQIREAFHIFAFWDRGLFGRSPSWTWREPGGTWTSSGAGGPDCSWDWRGRRGGSGNSVNK